MFAQIKMEQDTTKAECEEARAVGYIDSVDVERGIVTGVSEDTLQNQLRSIIREELRAYFSR